jgi:hypothetical protein
MPNLQNPEEYETHDIYLAAYFKYSGCRYIGRRQDRNGRRWWFRFSNPTGFSDLREAYFSGEAKVEAKAFVDEIQTMKELCFDPCT